jgi:hypothetical protein
LRRKNPWTRAQERAIIATKGDRKEDRFYDGYPLNRQCTCEIGNEFTTDQNLTLHMVVVEHGCGRIGHAPMRGAIHRVSGQLGNLARREVGCGLPSP